MTARADIRFAGGTRSVPTGNQSGGAAAASDRAFMASDDDRVRFGKVVLPYLSDAYSLARWIAGN